jgi:hypothetical protein
MFDINNMNYKVKGMSKRLLLTIPDSLWKKLKLLGIPHENDSELIRNALIILTYERNRKK